MRFSLKAISPDGRVESFDLHAHDRTAAAQRAVERGYTVISIRARGVVSGSRLAATHFPVVLFSQELLILLQAGLPLVEAIDTLAEKERRAEYRDVLTRIAQTLRGGRPLSSATEQFPGMFPPLYVATLRAAERTSDLAPALGRYVAYARQLAALRGSLVRAAIYPLVLLGVGGLVSLFLMLYVVPRFSRIYAERAADLPLFSKALLAWGQAVEGHGFTVAALLAVAAAGAVWAMRSTPAREWIESRLWRIPGIAERLRMYQLARFYRTAGMLLGGGIPLVTALQMAAELLSPSLREGLSLARQAISQGLPVSASMERHGLVTPVALRMLVVGERSGNMSEMMERIAIFHDEEIARWVDWATRLFEPLLMAAIGLVIGVIVVLMYMPIFELAGNVQ